jgi:predicted alpha/beta-hydrolase family hydrolase
VVEPSERFEEVKIRLPEPIHGLDEVSGVLGVPRWWPTGARVSVAIAHGANTDLADPLIEELHRRLTEQRYLALRFNFPFAEAKRKRPDSMQVLRRTYRAAIATLARDPTAAPAHLFLGGKGLGAQVAAEVASVRARVDGLFFIGYPLHPRAKPENVQTDQLFRVVSPMLFLQGTRDRYCDVDVLRRTLSRVGAPTTLQVCQEADQHFKVLKRSGRTSEEVNEEVVAAVDGWIHKVLEG